MINKHAYLILAFDEPYLLKKIINILDDERYDIYVHIDKKNYYKFQNVELVTKNAKLEVVSIFNVNWGGFSIVKAELFLLEQALKTKHTYYHFISGQDLPIKTNDQIYNFFEKNGNHEFVYFEKMKIDEKAIQRVSLFHWLREYCRLFKNKRINQIIHTIEKILLIIQKVLKVNRRKYYSEFQRGSQWVSITEAFAEKIIKDSDKIYHDFSFSFASDEMVFQTVAINDAEIKNRLFKLDHYNECIQNMRLIDWKRGGPYVYKKDDFEDIIESPYMFARKFSTKVDEDIINDIYCYLKSRN